ncbi:MAG: hypothetical protein V4471_01390 [Pseudomonadota bacterium]
MKNERNIKIAEKNIRLRGEAYKKGMLLLVNYLTSHDWKAGNKFPVRIKLIEENCETLYKNFVNDLENASTVKEQRNHFQHLLKKYKGLLLRHTALNDPFATLRIAECCSVWQEGRKSFKTVIDLEGVLQEENSNSANLFNMLQRETPITDVESLREEFAKVVLATPPFWFQCLPSWQQEFIKANYQNLSKKSIPSSLRCILGLANLSHHCFTINGLESVDYFRHATPLPVDLLNRADTADEAFRLTCLNIASQIKLSLDQQLLKQRDIKKWGEAVILTQSILSPGTAATLKSQYFSDVSDNDTKIYELKERAVTLFQQALERPTEYEDFLKEYGFKVENGSLEYKQKSIERITLLSTNHPYNILRRLGAYSPQTERNDLNTSLLLGAVARYLQHQLTLIESNKPKYKSEQFSQFLEDLDHAEQLKLYRQLSENLIACQAKGTVLVSDRKHLIKILERLLSFKPSDKFDKSSVRLFDALQALLSIPFGQGAFEADERHCQSLTSALEVIVVNCIGGMPWVACKSGKDRTGGASVAIDAAEMFYVQRGSYPRYSDTEEDRALYLQFVKILYESGHHQAVASQNAPGANGLVNPLLFLPKHVKLDRHHTQLETELARSNKPKNTAAVREAVNLRVFKKELNSIKPDKRVVLRDWRSNWRNYFIDGVSIERLRKGEEFASEEDLKNFIEEKLLYKIGDERLRKDYLALAFDSFHQGGFQHVFGRLFFTLQTQMNESDSEMEVIYQKSKEDYQINFSPLDKGIQIEEINTYIKKHTIPKVGDGDAEESSPRNGGYYYQTDSCISVLIKEDKKDSQSKVYTKIVNVSVDCEDERLKPIFFKKPSLLEVLIDFFATLWKVLGGYLRPAKEQALALDRQSGCQEDGGAVALSQTPLPGIIEISLLKSFLTKIEAGISCLMPLFFNAAAQTMFFQSAKRLAAAPGQIHLTDENKATVSVCAFST